MPASITTIIEQIKDYSEDKDTDPMDVVSELFEFFATSDDRTTIEELEFMLDITGENGENAPNTKTTTH